MLHVAFQISFKKPLHSCLLGEFALEGPHMSYLSGQQGKLADLIYRLRRIFLSFVSLIEKLQSMRLYDGWKKHRGAQYEWKNSMKSSDSNVCPVHCGLPSASFAFVCGSCA